jgi:uncharacterized delta-60 repeat protein
MVSVRSRTARIAALRTTPVVLGLMLVMPQSQTFASSHSPSAARPAEGSFDTSWSSDGVVGLPISSALFVSSVARQADGRVVIAGGSGDDFLVVRLKRGGSLDPSFGGTGIVTTPVATGSASASGVAIQPNGKIVVVGSADNGSNQDFAVVRYTAAGTPDPSFDGDGILTLDLSGAFDDARAVAVQKDGKIVVAGNRADSAQSDGAVVRLLANGAPDPSFDGDGIADTSSRLGGIEDHLSSVALQPNGRIVSVGYQVVGSLYNLLAVRFTAAGHLDTSFDDDGVANVNAANGNTSLGTGVAVQRDGRIVAGGWFNTPTATSTLVAQFTARGAADLSFSHDGRAISTVPGNFDDGRAVAVQSDGKIVTTGLAPDGNMNVERFKRNGAMDTTFHGTGYRLFALNGTGTSGYGILVQPDGKIVAVGSSVDASGSLVAIRLRGDTTPPSAAVVHLHRLAAHKARARWSATDANTGVASYDVQRRHSPPSGGAVGKWSTWKAHTKSHKAAFNMPSRTKVCVRARARDRAGNLGPWSSAECIQGR